VGRRDGVRESRRVVAASASVAVSVTVAVVEAVTVTPTRFPDVKPTPPAGIPP